MYYRFIHSELIPMGRNSSGPDRLLKRFGGFLSRFRRAIFSRRDDQADSVTGQFNLSVVIITS
jgi:hypothetical protein